MVKFKTTDEDANIMKRIVNRALSLNPQFDKFMLTMDIAATHANGCPLRLEEFLAADDFSFVHDIYGIAQHINRETGQLDGFQPRFAA